MTFQEGAAIVAILFSTLCLVHMTGKVGSAVTGLLVGFILGFFVCMKSAKAEGLREHCEWQVEMVDRAFTLKNRSVKYDVAAARILDGIDWSDKRQLLYASRIITILDSVYLDLSGDQEQVAMDQFAICISNNGAAAVNLPQRPVRRKQ